MMLRVSFMVSVAVTALACSTKGGDDNSNTTNNTPDASVSVDAGSVEDAGTPAPLDVGVRQLWGTDSSLPDGDLLPVAELLGPAQMVGIGESIHTSAGYFHMRTRLMRHMITHLGFRAVAFESSWRNIENILKPYVDHCTGTREAASMALHSIWWDVSTPEFLEWLCQWNTAHPQDTVGVFGMDIRHPWLDIPAFRAFLTTAAPSMTSLADGLSTCLGANFPDELSFFMDPMVRAYYSGTPTPEGDHTACQQGTTTAVMYLAQHQADLVAATNATEVERARLSVVGAGAFDDSIFNVSRNLINAGNAARDAAMYDILTSQQARLFPGVKTVLWAHNGHIMTHADELVNNQWTGVLSVGTRLGNALGADYVAVGQEAFIVDYDWLEGPMTLPTPGHNTVENWLEAFGQDFLWVDTAQAEGTAWPAQQLGLGFDVMLPSRHYQALVHHHHSPAAVFFTNPGF